MKLDARAIFTASPESFSQAMGTPESVEAFREKFITPAFERNPDEGHEIEFAFWEALRDFQESAFVVGFNAAAQLLMSCTQGERVA